METKWILPLLHFPVFAAAVYAIIVHRSLRKEVKTLSWFLITTGALQLISLTLWFLHLNNLFLLHILVPFRLVLLLLLYKEIFGKYVKSMIFTVVIAATLIFSVFNSWKWETINTINSVAMTVESVLLIILSLSSYIILLNKQFLQQLALPVRSLDWINRGVFVYYSSSLMLMYFGEQVIQLLNAEWNRYVWIAHGLLLVFLYYCFWKALWDSKIR